MLNNNNYDAIARDLAFEIHLGGDRFDAEDLHEVLRGIPQKDLDVFRSRVLYHAKDFVPDEPRFHAFAERQVDSWLSGAETAEMLGRKVRESWFRPEDFHEDRGKNFLLDDGSVRRCEKATAESEWGPKVREHILREMTDREVFEHNADWLLSSYGKQRNGVIEYDFVSPCFVPEGRVSSMKKDGDAIVLSVVSDALGTISMPLKDFYSDWPAMAAGALAYEVDERVYRDVQEASIRRQDVLDFKAKAGELIDREGVRVALDFLYDEVELTSSAKGRIAIRRDVDDLSDHHQFFIFVETPEGRTMTRVSEDADAGLLSRVSALMDERLFASVSVDSALSLHSDRVVFSDGPVVSVPFFADDAASPSRMKVRSIYSDDEGEVIVDGKLVGMEEKGYQSFWLSSLPDKSVKVLRESLDGSLALFEKREPAAQLGKKAAAPAVKARKTNKATL